MMSMSLDLPDQDYEMIELTGSWARERSIKTRKPVSYTHLDVYKRQILARLAGIM